MYSNDGFSPSLFGITFVKVHALDFAYNEFAYALNISFPIFWISICATVVFLDSLIFLLIR